MKPTHQILETPKPIHTKQIISTSRGSQLGVPPVETLDDRPRKRYDDHLKLPICEHNPDPILK